MQILERVGIPEQAHVFFDQGLIVEEAGPEELFSNPKSERTRLFLSLILQH